MFTRSKIYSEVCSNTVIPELNTITGNKEELQIYFNKYLNFMGEQDLFCSDNPRQIERHIIDFIVSLKEKLSG